MAANGANVVAAADYVTGEAFYDAAWKGETETVKQLLAAQASPKRFANWTHNVSRKCHRSVLLACATDVAKSTHIMLRNI